MHSACDTPTCRGKIRLDCPSQKEKKGNTTMIDYCHDSTEKGSVDYSKWTDVELFDALRDGGFCYESIQDELIERGLL